jgi:hypothetical protein
MSETEILWQLRQLPREVEPGRDLWPAIAEGIARQRAPRRTRWIAPLAMAASLLLTVGLVGRAQFQGAAAPPSPRAEADAISSAVVRSEARAVTDEYQAALRQFRGAPVPAEVAPSLQALDRSVVQIRRAIAADPDSVFLLEQLRRTYSTRLALTQRAITG